MIERIVRYRSVSLLSLAAFLFAAGGAAWAFIALHGITGPLILHFNDMDGITAIGNSTDIAAMGILGIIAIVIDFFVALGLEERDAILGKIVASVSLVLGILLFLAFAAIIRANG